ncbi:MAG: peptide chain release factor N(5)-glutamine methyltransferase [Anaerolineae bacterium]|nr:MAG: peptide chain release factor N(5)-glutamine methyltransferase [Anaerolineae bacterium]
MPPDGLPCQVGPLLQALKTRLAPLSETAWLDAQVLLAHILGVERAFVLAHPQHTLSADQLESVNASLQRLLAGEPLPYVLGQWEFYGLTFQLSPAVLIPRPETEMLVEHALAWLRQHSGRRRSLDVGTGSGCIAIALAKHVPDLHLLALDLSAAALKVARANASRHQVAQRIQWLQADLLTPLSTHAVFDLICANPPYIPTAVLHGLDVHEREPTLALDGGDDGLAVIRPLLRGARHHLRPGGLLLMEIEASLGQAAASLAGEAFPEAEVQILPDLAGHDRLLKVQTAHHKA